MLIIQSILAVLNVVIVVDEVCREPNDCAPVKECRDPKDCAPRPECPVYKAGAVDQPATLTVCLFYH